MVDLFHKAVTEETRWSLWKRGRKVTTKQKHNPIDRDRQTDTQTGRYVATQSQ